MPAARGGEMNMNGWLTLLALLDDSAVLLDDPRRRYRALSTAR
ncbi:hypothetical protein ACIREE_39470 [Streptomyces sp. NPDC102467]